MRRQRSVDDAARCVQPTLAVRLHDERVGTADGVRPSGVLVGNVIGTLVRDEIRYVMTGPLTGVFVPPDVRLALAPRVALRVRRRAVVDDATVCRPCPSPLRRDPGLLAPGFAPVGLVDA